MRADLPGYEPSRELAQWLAGPRNRLLRRAQIGLRQRVLEVGCGHGIVTEELARRAPGAVVGIDADITPAADRRPQGARLAAADVALLPFGNGSFDLVFCQNVLLWIRQPQAAIAEAMRVLGPGGALVAIEPDFGGMMEHPPEVALRDVWLGGLRRAGAAPEIGRKLPGLCEAAGLDVWVELQATPREATAEALRLSKGLPLTDEEHSRVDEAEAALSRMPGGWAAFVHVPYVLVVGTKRT